MSYIKCPILKTQKGGKVLKRLGKRLEIRFLLGHGIEIYERIHFLRGLENTWTDIYLERKHLEGLLDILVDINLEIIHHYAEAGVDGFISCDDWGSRIDL